MTQPKSHVVMLGRLVVLIIVKTCLLQSLELSLLRDLPQADNRLSIVILRLAILVSWHIIIVDLHELEFRLLLDILCRFFYIFTFNLAHLLRLHVVFLGWLELRGNRMECCGILGRRVLCFHLFEHF